MSKQETLKEIRYKTQNGDVFVFNKLRSGSRFSGAFAFTPGFAYMMYGTCSMVITKNISVDPNASSTSFIGKRVILTERGFTECRSDAAIAASLDGISSSEVRKFLVSDYHQTLPVPKSASERKVPLTEEAHEKEYDKMCKEHLTKETKKLKKTSIGKTPKVKHKEKSLKQPMSFESSQPLNTYMVFGTILEENDQRTLTCATIINATSAKSAEDLMCLQYPKEVQVHPEKTIRLLGVSDKLASTSIVELNLEDISTSVAMSALNVNDVFHMDAEL